MTLPEFQLLVALGTEPRHGYAIMQAVEAQTGAQVRIQTGALYRTLKRMLSDGWIDEVAPPADAERTDERRRYYALTPAGRVAVAEEASRLRAALTAASEARLLVMEDG